MEASGGQYRREEDAPPGPDQRSQALIRTDTSGTSELFTGPLRKPAVNSQQAYVSLL